MAPLSETRRVSIKQPAEEEVVKVSMHWTEAWKVTAMHAKFCEEWQSNSFVVDVATDLHSVQNHWMGW